MTRVRKTHDINIGKMYMVEQHLPDGKKDKALATIIHMEFRDGSPPSTSLLSSDERGEDAKVPWYYVHYEMQDRRNDAWVSRDRIFESVESHGQKIIPENVTGEQLSKGALTRSQRRIHEEFNHLRQDFEKVDATTARLEKEHEERTKVKNIPTVTIGQNKITSWYYSPFPAYCNNQDLYMCEYCLVYTPSKRKFSEHYYTCLARQPPGNEIYRKHNLSVYEVYGTQHKLYCQCLCLLSKLFMDHKTLYFDVDDFVFYALCEVDTEGAHIVGYYSREIDSNNNLACIMVFPPFQDKGYGKLLIQLSYEMSAREGYIGTPEKPLSDLGKVSYRSYWWYVLLDLLTKQNFTSITASELSAYSGIAIVDIVATLDTMKMVRTFSNEVTDERFMIRCSPVFLDHCIQQKLGKKPKILLDKEALKWEPRRKRDAVEMEYTEMEEADDIVYANNSPRNGGDRTPGSVRSESPAIA